VAVSAASDAQVRTAHWVASPPAVEEAVRINGRAREGGLTAAMLLLAIGAAVGLLVSLRLPRGPAGHRAEEATRGR